MFGKTCISIRYGCCHAGECRVIGTMKQVVPETQIRPLAATAGGGRKLLVRPTLFLTVIGGPLVLSPSDTGQLCGNLEQRNNAMRPSPFLTVSL